MWTVCDHHHEVIWWSSHHYIEPIFNLRCFWPWQPNYLKWQYFLQPSLSNTTASGHCEVQWETDTHLSFVPCILIFQHWHILPRSHNTMDTELVLRLALKTWSFCGSNFHFMLFVLVSISVLSFERNFRWTQNAWRRVNQQKAVVRWAIEPSALTFSTNSKTDLCMHCCLLPFDLIWALVISSKPKRHESPSKGQMCETSLVGS